MTKDNRKLIMEAVKNNCANIRKVKRKHIVFGNQSSALDAYRYVWQHPQYGDVCQGMEMLGGDRIVYYY